LPYLSNPGTFTCISCQIQFPAPELQRIHMKTDWHRYNLKRRVTGLSAVTASTFRSKIATQQRHELANSNEDEYGFHIHHKNKNNKSERQLTKKDLKKLHNRGRKLVDDIDNDDEEQQQMIGSPSGSIVSRASRVSEFSLGTVQSEFSSAYDTDDLRSELSKDDDDDLLVSSDDEMNGNNDIDLSTDDEDFDEEDDEDEKIELPLTTCFYCGEDNGEREQNIKHMFSKHGLYIPERSFLFNVDGLLRYIADSISLDLECLKCGFIGKNLYSIRHHLQGKGHCVLPYETKDERELVKEFFDFRTVDDNDKKNKKNNGKKVAFASNEITSDDEAEEMESDNTDEDVDVETDEDEVYEESEYTTALIDKTGVELVLPNGYKVGHRSMSRYYRQNF
ncbi:hypothetical protein CANARDRAFT_188983, partial [[Candida] arabinofermentans NRRL YB-2248]